MSKSCFLGFWYLLAGAILNLVGFIYSESFMILYLFSIPILAIGYYRNLQSKSYQPLKMFSFWGMVIILVIPIFGLLAGILQLRATQQRDENPEKRDNLLTTLTALMLFIPFVLICAAVTLPDFAAYSQEMPMLMQKIFIFGLIAEIVLIILWYIVKYRKKTG